MKVKLYLVFIALLSLLQVQAQNQVGETLFSETFANVNESSNQLIPADMSKFDNPTGWTLKDVYAGENCLYLSEGSSISFPTVKDLMGNAVFEIDAAPWQFDPNPDDPNFDIEEYEKKMHIAGEYHMTIENGELCTSKFDMKATMNGAPFIYGVSPDTKLTLHADGPLIIRAIYIGYGEKNFWTDGKPLAGYNPAPGIYYDAFELNITPDMRSTGFGDDGSHNYAVYTLDGTKPNRNSPRWTSPLNIDKTTTVQVATIYGNGLLWADPAQTYEIQGASVATIPDATFEITVDKPGNLKNKILDIDADEINGLVIHGKINGEDLAYINSGSGRMGGLTYLNLSDITFDYDDSVYKTLVYAPEGGMGTVTTVYYRLSETNKMEGGNNGLGKATYIYYSNNLAGLFARHQKIELVVLPDFLTSLGSSAFTECPSLVQVKHNGKLTEIENSAFYYCQSFNNIDLSNVVKVGENAFYASDLRGAVDFSKIKEFGAGSFKGTKISSIKFGSPSFIGEGAFAGTPLKRLDLPNPPDTIPATAFACYDSRLGENSLKTVVLGEGVRYIGKNAFGEGVEEMNFPSSMEELEAEALPKKIVDKIEPEGGIKYVGKIAYTIDQPRASFTVKEGTKSIADGAFSSWNSSEIEEVILPASVEVIGNNAFSMTGLKKTPDMSNVKQIKDGAFAYCKSLARAVLPENLEYIGYDIFSYCDALWYLEYNAIDAEYEYLKFPKVEKIILGDKVRKVPTGLYSENQNVTEVTLPASVEIIDDNAFYLCSNLEYIRMSDNVTTIGDNAFALCSKLNDFHWPANLKSIGAQAFRECESLKTISLPEGMEFVGRGAFQQCSGVESIYIASSISEFEYDPFTFWNQDKAFTITAPSKVPQTVEWNWHYLGTPTIKVPAASIQAYKADPVWSGANNSKDNLIIPIEGIAATSEVSETSFAAIDSDSDLADAVVGDVYVTVGEDDGYDESDGSIFLNSSMDEEYMEAVAGMAPGASDLANRFNGLVVMVPAGNGKVTVNCLTLGSRQVAVKIGDEDSQSFSMSNKGNVEIDYNVAEDTYVYIYAIEANAPKQMRKVRALAAASENCVKIYSIAVNPTEVTGVESIFGGNSAISPIVEYYTIDGTKVANPTSGIYIVRRADGSTSKIMIK